MTLDRRKAGWMAVLAAAFIVSGGALPVEAQSIAPWNKPCKKLYTQYQDKKGHKAIAVSRAQEGMAQGCGVVWNAPSKAAAEQAAVKSCKRSGGVSTCQVMHSQ